jgi:hypothetical protein
MVLGAAQVVFPIIGTTAGLDPALVSMISKYLNDVTAGVSAASAIVAAVGGVASALTDFLKNFKTPDGQLKASGNKKTKVSDKDLEILKKIQSDSQELRSRVLTLKR